MSQFFGKYRGKVESNVDPMELGRVQVSVPAVLGEGTLSWAMPCVPYAGDGVGFFFIPPKGANIWVEFEGGDTDYPIWSGCFWGDGEMPLSPAVAGVKMLKTEGITLEMNDTSDAGGFTLLVDEPGVSSLLKMVFDSDGILIENDPVKVTITATDIEMSNDPVSIKMTDEDIEMKNDPSTIKLTSSDIELGIDPAKVKISDSEVVIELSSATITVGDSDIEIKNGGATIKIESSKVDVNSGALEVST